MYLHLNKEIKIALLNILDYQKIGKDETGTYALQYLLENMQSEEEISSALIKIEPLFLEMSYHIYGSHIVEKGLFYAKWDIVKDKFEKIVLTNFISLSTHVHGIKVLKFFCARAYIAKDYSYYKQLISDFIEVLVNDEYGNYLLQDIVNYWKKRESMEIITSKLKNKLTSFCTMKFAANVIEKMLIRHEKVSNTNF